MEITKEFLLDNDFTEEFDDVNNRYKYRYEGSTLNDNEFDIELEFIMDDCNEVEVISLEISTYNRYGYPMNHINLVSVESIEEFIAACNMVWLSEFTVQLKLPQENGK